VPAPLVRIIQKALAKDPAARHQSMAEFAADLSRFGRAYDGETRLRVAALRDRHAAIEALVAEHAELSAGEGFAPRGDAAPVARRLRDEYPAFVDQGAGGLLLVPFSRRRAAEIAAELDAEHGPLALEVARLRARRNATGRFFVRLMTALGFGSN
jgi:hypothetical protein